MTSITAQKRNIAAREVKAVNRPITMEPPLIPMSTKVRWVAVARCAVSGHHIDYHGL